MKKLFIKNREKLFNMIDNNSVIILFAGKSPRKSGDETYQFTPNRNFYYLSGNNEQEDILVLTKIKNKCTSYMFINEYDEFKAKWVGKTYTDEEIKNISGIENVRYLPEFESFVNSLVTRLSLITFYFDLERQAFDEIETISQIKAKQLKDKYPSLIIKDCYSLIAELRMNKEEEEITLIKNAISITNSGILSLLDNAKPNMMEYELESYFDQKIKEKGASDFAFTTIAASGKNACVLHYSENNCIINDGDLILFDLGAEYNYYKSDITRTFPVNGKFSEQQKLVYNIVLKGQELVFENIKPGLSTRDLNLILIKYFAEELKRIGLIKEDKEVSKYYFHGVSHHIGLDTHDACVYDKLLTPGCIISVEPGLYIPEWNIGIRIEDDALVTENGSINLSSEIIKTVDEIEEYMAKRK